MPKAVWSTWIPRAVGWTAAIASLTLLIALLVIGSGSVRSFALTDDEAAFWDVLLKTVGGILALGGAYITAAKWIEEQARANQAAEAANVTARIESQKPFYSRRQDVYYDLVTTTATLSNAEPGSDRWWESHRHFWVLYWGPIPLVADIDVGALADQFSILLDHPLENAIPLRNCSMNLARTCRRSLGYIIDDGTQVPVGPATRGELDAAKRAGDAQTAAPATKGP